MKKFLFLSLIFLAPVAVFGVTEVPDGDPLSALLNLVLNFKTISPLAIASSAIVIFVQLVKKYMPGFKYYDIVVVLGGLIYGTIQSLMSGMDIFSSLVFIFITSGGAMMLYNLFKTPLNAVFKVPSK